MKKLVLVLLVAAFTLSTPCLTQAGAAQKHQVAVKHLRAKNHQLKQKVHKLRHRLQAARHHKKSSA